MEMRCKGNWETEFNQRAAGVNRCFAVESRILAARSPFKMRLVVCVKFSKLAWGMA
jgi:hypothetical protein